jgi:hypothetical protein
VSKVELSPGGDQTIVVRHNETTKTVRVRWIVDASDVAALLARNFRRAHGDFSKTGYSCGASSANSFSKRASFRSG